VRGHACGAQAAARDCSQIGADVSLKWATPAGSPSHEPGGRRAEGVSPGSNKKGAVQPARRLSCFSVFLSAFGRAAEPQSQNAMADAATIPHQVALSLL